MAEPGKAEVQEEQRYEEIVQRLGKVVERYSEVGMLGPQRLLQDRQCA